MTRRRAVFPEFRYGNCTNMMEQVHEKSMSVMAMFRTVVRNHQINATAPLGIAGYRVFIASLF